MKSKHLLLMLLLALLAPWAANAQEPIPYNEGFETMSSADDLTTAGWISYKSSSGSFLAIETSASNVHTGSKALNIDSWSASSTSDWVVVGLPIVNEAINGLQITFSYKVSTGNVSIGYLTDANDASTFVPLQQYNSSTNYTTIERNLSDAPASAARIAIKYSNWYRCYIDDIEVKALPTCLKPTNLLASNITTNTANLSWTANSGESVWTIFYKKTTDENYTEVSNVTDNPHTLPGLSDATDYQFYVVAKCSSTDISDPSSVKTFTTACEAISAVGYSEKFDSYTGTTSGSTNILPDCWNYINTCSYSSYSGYPNIYSTASYSSSSPNCLKFYSYYSGWTDYDPQPQYAILPPMEQLAGMQVTLKARGNNTTSTFKIGTMSDPADVSTFTAVTGSPDNPAAMTTSYQEYTFYIPSTTTDRYVAIMIEAATSSRTTNGVYIDDIEFSVAPTCWQPQNLTASDVTNEGATLTWERHAMGDETAWVLQYSTDNTFATATTVNVNINPTHTIASGLEASSTYSVRVKPACDNEGNLWSEVVEFTTAASCMTPDQVAVSDVDAHGATLDWNGNNESFTVRYRKAITAPVNVEETYDFEDGTLQGWTTISNDNDNNAWTNQSGNAHQGNRCVRARYVGSSDGGDANDWLISPQVPLGGTLGFYARRYGANYTDQFQVYVSTTGSEIADFTAISEVITPNATYDYYEYDLSAFSGNGYVAIVYTAPNDQYYLYVDDITYTNTIPGVYDEWQTVENAAKPYPFSGLDAESYYEVQVMGHCGSETSGWSEPTGFATTIACPAPTNLAVAANADDATTQEDLTWVMTGAETDWQLCLNDDEEHLIAVAASDVTVTGNTVAYTLTGLTPAHDYTVKVRANCGTLDGQSAWSNTQIFQTEATCDEPTDFVHGTVDAHNAPLSWTEAGAATQWQIRINNDMDNLILISNTTTGVTVEGQNVSYTLTGLTAETDYTVELRAYCADGDGNQSPWVTTSFTTLVACLAPTDLQVEASALDATFSWEGEAGSYEVVTSMNSSDNPSDLVSTPVTGNDYIFTNLELGNHYFWVRSNCSANDEGYSTWAGPVSVHIGYCEPNPTSHDGSGITGVTFGMGSNVVENGDGTTSLPASAPFYGDYSSMIGAVQAGVESTISITTATGNWPYTFVIWVDLDNSLSFEDSEVLYVGKATSGVGTHTATITIPATQATGDYRMRIYGADSYFSSFYNNGSTNWEAAHDPCATGTYRHAHDYTVRVLEAPSCLTPTNVEITYTGGTSATISWTSEATAWNMRVNGVDVNGVITNPYTLTGLELATTYSVEVQANCGANGLSEWSTPVNFTTDFCQSENMCAINYSFTDQYNDSWNNAYMNIVDALTGKVLYQLTMPNVAGPYEGSFNVCDGRDIQFVWVSGNYPNECGYVFTDINDEVILEKAVNTTAPAEGVVITHSVDCTLPTCAKPTALNATAITNNSATLSWTANSGETAWTLYYKKTTDENYTEVTENVTNPYTLTVEASTEYIFYVVANCSETEESEPSATFTFTTQCNPITVDADNPFTENFDAGTFPPTDCWNTISNDTYNWTIDDSENHNEGGSASAYSGYYGDVYLIMPTLTIADNEGPVKLTFWSYNTYTSYYGKNSVVLLGNTETELWSPASVSNSWEETTIDISAYKGQTITLAFKYEGDNAHGWYVDDVWVGYLPSYTKVVESGKWYAISSPVNTPAVNEVDNLTDGNYDFYRYDEASATWENYKAHATDFTTFENCRGYIYRRDGNKNLTFTGFPNTAANYFLTANRADDLKGFNLLGNPFANPYTYGGNCYALTEKGTWMAKTNYTIPVCEAILVKVNITTNYVFSPATKSAPKAVEALAFTVSGNGYEDVTYAMLEEGEGLTKVAHLADEAPALSIPVDGSNYAIAYLGYEVESFPLTLNATAGEYTIALNNQISGLSYCHLLDKETGKETDLLKGAYTFKANGNSDRFTVLLNASLENGEIAIWNGNSWIVNGEGTLQVFDVMGRRVYNQEVAGQSSLNTDELATGVYVIRLGEKSQKIVVK